MSKPFEIEEKGLEEKVIKRYLETHNMAQVARECNISYFNLVHYITWVKEEHPKWLEEYDEQIKVDVFRTLNKYIRKIDKKLDKWEDEGKDKTWLSGLREMRGFLESYTGTIEKLSNIRKQNEEEKAILEAIREESPEVAIKIISKLKKLREERKLLE